MFQFPEQTAVNRVLPKTKIYDKARPTKAVRDLFVAEVEQIVWKHKLSPHSPLPLSLNLKSLYDQMLRAFIALPAREGEELPDLVEREYGIRQLQRQLKQLETKLRAEKQFNRKVDLNTEARRLTAVLSDLETSIWQ